MGQAVFKSKLSFRPYSTESFTHRKITLSLADRSQKTQKIKVISEVGMNPEAGRWQKIKQEEQSLRFAFRREQKKKRVRERGAAGKGLTAGYLEGAGGGDTDDDEEGVSLMAIKNKFKNKSKTCFFSLGHYGHNNQKNE
jgi:RNA polymerase-associated protein LEO1